MLLFVLSSELTDTPFKPETVELVNALRRQGRFRCPLLEQLVLCPGHGFELHPDHLLDKQGSCIFCVNGSQVSGGLTAMSGSPARLQGSRIAISKGLQGHRLLLHGVWCKFCGCHCPLDMECA